MPLKITIGLGKVAHTSRGEQISATCGMEIELDPSNGEVNRDEIQRRMARGYATCWQAIIEELERRSASGSQSRLPDHSSHHSSNSEHSRRDRLATAAQVKAIYAIAKRQKLDIPTMLRERFSVTKPQELSIREASELIDTIKG